MMEVAWLEYSTQQIDKDLLAHKIFRNSVVEVGMSWKQIYLGKNRPME